MYSANIFCFADDKNAEKITAFVIVPEIGKSSVCQP